MPPPPPVQRPRIPVWVVGLWPSERSMRRVARWDGWLPNLRQEVSQDDGAGGTAAEGEAGPADTAALAEGVAWLRAERARLGVGMDGFDVVAEGTTEPGAEGAALTRAWAEAGATWWLEANWTLDPAEVERASRQRLRTGPPRW